MITVTLKAESTMPAVPCPISGCDYKTADLDAAIVAALITAHSAFHTQGQTAKVEMVKRSPLTLLVQVRSGLISHQDGQTTLKQLKSQAKIA